MGSFQFTGRAPTLGGDQGPSSSFATFRKSDAPILPPLTPSAKSGSASILPKASMPPPRHSVDRHPLTSPRAGSYSQDRASEKDLLTESLNRVVSGKQALFGRMAIAADSAVRDLLAPGDDPRPAANSLLECLDRNAALSGFTRSMSKKYPDEKIRGESPFNMDRRHKLRDVKVKIESPDLPKWLLPPSTSEASKTHQEVVEVSDTDSSKCADCSGGDLDENGSVFRFLDMAPELRNLVYRMLLVSKTGYIAHETDIIRWNQREQGPLHLPAMLEADILAVCKQTHTEAKSILYQENTFIMTGQIVLSNMATLRHFPLPSKALSLITSLTLVCDHTDGRDHTKITDYSKLIWRQFQDLTNLKRLRICEVEREDNRKDDDRKELMLEQIIERIPADCELSYGSRPGIEKDYVEHMIERVDEIKHKTYYELEDAMEVNAETVERCAKKSLSKQGIKSGDTKDYRFSTSHTDWSKLGTLAGNETLDPRLMFGGSA